MTAPRLFISYSWSSQDHENWVADLATQLTESGIDVVFDKWELKEGHDSIAFMEKMVTDPTIKKVAVISDKKYAEKANKRMSGVGTETQIISAEVYEKQDQDKFVAVLPERDPDGNPYLPAYYKGRIYIDLSSPEKYANEFERLVRWVFNRPMHRKPEIGQPPAFLSEDPAKSLGTSAAFHRAIDAVKNGRPNMEGATDDYLTTFAQNLERFRIALGNSKEFDEQIAESIDEFTPYRSEFVQLVISISQYAATNEMGKNLHRFFERLLPYLDRPEGVRSHHTFDYDNFKFIVHELFLYTIAILLRYERFESVGQLLETPYYVSTNAERGKEPTVRFDDFRSYMGSFEARDKRLGKHSSRGLLLKQRAESSGFDFKWLMQADFLLYLRAALVLNEYWWPETLVYATHAYGPMEIFARAQSAQYYDRMKPALGNISSEDLKAGIAKLHEDRRVLPNWGGIDRISPSTLTGIDRLSTAP